MSGGQKPRTAYGLGTHAARTSARHLANNGKLVAVGGMEEWFLHSSCLLAAFVFPLRNEDQELDDSPSTEHSDL